MRYKLKAWPYCPTDSELVRDGRQAGLRHHVQVGDVICRTHRRVKCHEILDKQAFGACQCEACQASVITCGLRFVLAFFHAVSSSLLPYPYLMPPCCFGKGLSQVEFDVKSFCDHVYYIGRPYRYRAIELIKICQLFSVASDQSFCQDTELLR